MIYNLQTLRNELIRDEGDRQYPYTDTVGKLTIGVGWNLTDKGLPPSIRDELLSLAIHEAELTLNIVHPGWRGLTDTRQRVLLNMAFNLGFKLKRFKRFLAALDIGDYSEASRQMLRSKWACQVGARATRLAKMMEEG